MYYSFMASPSPSPSHRTHKFYIVSEGRDVSKRKDADRIVYTLPFPYYLNPSLSHSLSKEKEKEKQSLTSTIVQER